MSANIGVERETIVKRPDMSLEGMRVSWGGVWAGVLVALGTLLVLSTLGLAVGFSADGRSLLTTSITGEVGGWDTATGAARLLPAPRSVDVIRMRARMAARIEDYALIGDL